MQVVLCEDAIAYPLMVRGWLAELPGLELVEVVGSRAQLLERLPALRPDVLLLDVVLPDGEADARLVAAARAAAGGPLRVVLVSSFPPDRLQAICLETGADGCCSKLDGLDGLLTALQSTA